MKTKKEKEKKKRKRKEKGKGEECRHRSQQLWSIIAFFFSAGPPG